MKTTVEDAPPAPAIIDVAVADTAPMPYLSIEVAKVIITHLGVGGCAYVRTPYLCKFYGAAEKLGCAIGIKQCFRSGIAMHRITRTR